MSTHPGLQGQGDSEQAARCKHAGFRSQQMQARFAHSALSPDKVINSSVSTAGSLLWSVSARRGAASCDAKAVLQLNA
jgi:hypothetical protein